MTKEISKETRQKVREKLEFVSKRLSEMASIKDAGPKTNGVFHWNGRIKTTEPQASSINISKIIDITLLISILGFLTTRKLEYDHAAKELQLSTFPVFTWSGYSLEAWKHDINSRICVITHSDEISKLEKVKAELSKYISEEDRIEELLNSIDI